MIHLNIAGLDWRPIFLINIPVGIFALLAGRKYLPNGKAPHPLKLDIIGTVIIAVALFLLVLPLIEGRELGWPTWSFVMMAASVPMLFVFAWWQRVKDKKDGSPLVVPALVRIKTFVVGLTINLTFEGAMIGFFLPFTLLLQVGLGFSVIKAALTGIPTAIGISVTMAVFSQKVIGKLGRNAMVLGVVLMGSGLSLLYVMLKKFGLDMSPFAFIPGLLLVGSGMALIMSPMFSVALSDIDAKHAGSASGVLNAVQQLGGAIGVALIGLVFFSHVSHHAPQSFDAVVPQLHKELTALQVPAAAQEQIIASSKTCFVDRSAATDGSEVPESCKQLQAAAQNSGLPAETAQELTNVVTSNVKQANSLNFVSSFGAAVAFELALLVVIFFLSFLLPRRIKMSADMAH